MTVHSGTILTCPSLLRDCRQVLGELQAHLLDWESLDDDDGYRRGEAGRLMLLATAMDMAARVAAWQAAPAAGLHPKKPDPAALVRAAGSDRHGLVLALRLARLEARLLRMTAETADSPSSHMRGDAGSAG